MRLCTLRIASDEGSIKATSLDAALVEPAPWCRTTPNAPLIRIKPPARADPPGKESLTQGTFDGYRQGGSIYKGAVLERS